MVSGRSRRFYGDFVVVHGETHGMGLARPCLFGASPALLRHCFWHFSSAGVFLVSSYFDLLFFFFFSL